MSEIRLALRRGPSFYEWQYCEPFFKEQIRWNSTEVPRTTSPEEAAQTVAQVYRKQYGHPADQVVKWEWKPAVGHVAHAFESAFLGSVIGVRKAIGIVVVLAILAFCCLFVVRVIEWVLR